MTDTQTDRRTDGQKKRLIEAQAFALSRKEHLVSQYIIPVNERIFHITEISFLSLEEQRTPHVTRKRFLGAGDILPVKGKVQGVSLKLSKSICLLLTLENNL